MSLVKIPRDGTLYSHWKLQTPLRHNAPSIISLSLPFLRDPDQCCCIPTLVIRWQQVFSKTLLISFSMIKNVCLHARLPCKIAATALLGKTNLEINNMNLPPCIFSFLRLLA